MASRNMSDGPDPPWTLVEGTTADTKSVTTSS